MNAATREISRAKGDRYFPGSYRLVTADVYRVGVPRPPYIPEPPSGIIPSTTPGGYGKIKQASDVPERYILRSLYNPGPLLIDLPPSAYNTALHGPCGS